MKKILTKLTVNQYGKIKFFTNFLFQKKSNINVSSSKKIWFLDAPDYANLGDQAIALGIKKFCQDYSEQCEIIEFQEKDVISYISWIKKNIGPQDIIVLQGGGNFGDLYPRYEFIRRTIVKEFPETKTIIFPLSVSYKNEISEKKETKEAIKIYDSHRNLTIFARDSKSYVKLKKTFLNTKIGLCPDIVFYLNNLVTKTSRDGLGVCIRDDKEKIFTSLEISNFIQNIQAHYKNIRYFDTTINNNVSIKGNLREKKVIDKLVEFASCELIITDRLHGMIFSYITSTPCIALDNTTGKSECAYSDWLKNKKNIVFLNTIDKDISFPNFEKSENLDFQNLKKVLTGD